MTKIQLLLQGYETDNHNSYSVTVETFVTLYVYKSLNVALNDFEIIIVNYKDNGDKFRIQINREKYSYIDHVDIVERATACNPPILFLGDGHVIAGLCSVVRSIIKSCLATNSNGFCSKLLGFKSACLQSPTESSIWTKYCEMDIITCIKSMNQFFCGGKKGESVVVDRYSIPEDLLKFESHLKQPVRAHNVYKLADELSNMQIDRSTPIRHLSIEHKFAEGHNLTLSDAVLFPCFYIIFERFFHRSQSNIPIPLIKKWFENVRHYDENRLERVFKELRYGEEPVSEKVVTSYEVEKLIDFSLYKSDPNRYKPKNRIYTRQADIEKSLKLIELLENIVVSSDIDKHNTLGRQQSPINWCTIPDDILDVDSIPVSRLKRKRDQLLNMAAEIVSIAKNGDRIVDFCSGTGHLAILLAHLLPHCHIILLETKEFSVNIAKERAAKLHLKNISFYQCNLDYFTQPFEIGTSLHACGVATDIVLQLCVKKRAHFVSAPCCYGKIHQMPHVTYPRSKLFSRVITYSDYNYIAHCADQTHDIATGKCNQEKSVQGDRCMDIIDTDRKIMAEENGYRVILTKMIPENCSIKNRMLVGISK